MKGIAVVRDLVLAALEQIRVRDLHDSEGWADWRFQGPESVILLQLRHALGYGWGVRSQITYHGDPGHPRSRVTFTAMHADHPGSASFTFIPEGNGLFSLQPAP